MYGDNSHNDGNYDTLLLIIRNIFEEHVCISQ